MGNCHMWGDKNFDWKALDKGMSICVKILKFARIGCDYKEKYGCFRNSITFWDGTLYGITHPGYYYLDHYPDWLRNFDQKWIKWFSVKTRLYVPVQWIQKRFYTLGYYVAMKKYPHVAEELCVDADFPELIIGGQKIHDKYWTTWD